MCRNIALLLFLICCSNVFGQQIDWEKKYDFLTKRSYIQSFDKDGDNFIVTTTKNGDTLGTGGVMLINLNGDTLWTRSFNSNFWAYYRSPIKTLKDGYIIAGIRKRRLPDTIAIQLIKLRKDGSVVWNKIFNTGRNNNIPLSINIKNDNEYSIFFVSQNAEGTTPRDYSKSGVLNVDSLGNTNFLKIYGLEDTNVYDPLNFN